MSTKNFVSYGDAETLFTDVGNKISRKQEKPTTISYADWLLLTPQQQETGNWLVTGVPGADLSLRVLALETNKQDKTDNNLQTTSKETTGAINELKSGLTNLKYHKVAESASTGTYAVKLQSLATAYNNLSLSQKRSALLVVNTVDIYHPVNCSGNWFSVWVDSTAAYLSRYGIDGSAYIETGGTVTDNSSVENANVFELWICES